MKFIEIALKYLPNINDDADGGMVMAMEMVMMIETLPPSRKQSASDFVFT